MKKVLSLVLCAVIICVCTVFAAPASFAASGKSYYFDSVRGNDASAGTTPEAAFKNASKLAEIALNPGDSVYFKRGQSFECTLTLSCSGTEESPITITCYGDEGLDKPLLTTNARTEVLKLVDCCYLTLKNLEITAHNGGGIWIDTIAKTSVGITLDSLDIHDIQNYKVTYRDNLADGACAARACLMVKGLPAHSRYAANDLTVKNCEMFDCGNGISLWGSWNDSQTPWCENEEDIDPVYNTGVLVEGCYFHDMDAEAIIIGMCDGALVTNCKALDCCQGEGVDENGKVLYYTAAIWFWGSENSTVDHCEIAGQKNVGDGMAVDFDSHSNNCTYQYIYSHDNTRFMCNCPNYSGHHGNTVRYCLSVNDNRGRSRMASDSGEYGFSFYNNTIINCGEFQMQSIYDATVVNNIIMPAPGYTIAYNLDALSRNNRFSNNCYYSTITPLVDRNSLNVVPGFAGTKYNNPESFVLSASSPLIGAGCAVENELTHDFYGNPLASNNIGCYSGVGVQADYSGEALFARVIRLFKLVLEVLDHELSNAFENIIDEIKELFKN